MARQGVHESLQSFSPQDLVRAEGLLGVPLTPEGLSIEYQMPMFTHADDVRAYAADYALGGYDQLVDFYDGLSEDDPTDRQLLAVYREELVPVARHVVVANNLLKWQATAHPGETARDRFQRTMMSKIYAGMQTYVNPATVDAEGKIPNAILAVAPTGSGKTVLQARMFDQAGIGCTLEGIPSVLDPEGEHLRGLMVLPDQQALLQYAGKIGNNTFRRFLGRDVPVTSYWEESKNTSGSVVLVTRQSLPKALKRGDIVPEDYAVIGVDEGHHLLEPRMQNILDELRQTRLAIYTATPAYEQYRDLRRLFNCISVGSVREFVENGILNPVRLYSFRGGLETAISLAQQRLEQGRKVVSYFQAGGESQQARQAATAVNTRLDCPKDEPIAKAVGRFQSRAEDFAAMSEFDAGDVRMLAATRMLRENWDAEVDVAIIYGGLTRLETGQACGRVLRPGQHVSEIYEVLPETDAIAPGFPVYSIFDTFDIGDIVPGLLIGSQYVESGDAEMIPVENVPLVETEHDSSWIHEIAPEGCEVMDEGLVAIEALDAQDTEGADESHAEASPDLSHGTGSEVPLVRNQLAEAPVCQGASPELKLSPSRPVGDALARAVTAKYVVMPLDLPAKLLESVVPRQPVRQATVAPLDLIRMGTPPEGFGPTRQTALDAGISPRLLWRILDGQGFSYVGVRPIDPDEQFDRWYGAEAFAYLAEHPPLVLAQASEFTAADLASMTGVDRVTIKRFIDDLPKAPYVTRNGQANRRLKHYTYEVTSKVLKHYLEDIPEAADTDVPLVELAATHGDQVYFHVKNLGFEAVEKRMHPSRPVKKTESVIKLHLTADEAAAIAAKVSNIVIADPDADMNITEIAAVAGVSISTVTHNLSNAERGLLAPKRPNPRSRDYEYLPTATGMEIAARLKPRRLQLTTVASRIMVARSSADKGTVPLVLARTGFEKPLDVLNIGGSNGFGIKTYPWEAMRVLESIHPPKAGEPAVDFALLGNDPDRMSAKALMHAKEILAHYVGLQKVDTSPLEGLLAERHMPKATSAELKATVEEEIMSMRAVQARLVCTPQALAMLFMDARPPQDAIVRQQDGVYLRESTVRHLERLASHVRPLQEGWIAYNRLADAVEDETGQELAAILRLVQISEERQCLARLSDGTFDVSYDHTTKLLIRKTARRQQLLAMEPEERHEETRGSSPEFGG